MTKIVQFFHIQNSLTLFSDKEKIQTLLKTYSKTDLGKLELSIPWRELKSLLGRNTNTKGPQPLLEPKSQVAIMILKAYSRLSDKKLAERINSDLHYRIFCGLPLSFSPIIKNYKYISRIRCDLSKRIEWNKLEKKLYDHWSEYIKNKDHVLIDATCYETDMRYPTDVKLVWESLTYIKRELKKLCKATKTKQPRSKYNELQREYIIYSRLRRKGIKRSKKILKKLLYLSTKLLLELELIQEQNSLPSKSKQNIITKVLCQQRKKLEGEEVKSRIVSLHKDYIRPIIRGKETKRVEFGCKVNKIQIDGINFIEHLSFEAFNEGTKYESSIKKAEELTNIKVKVTGADSIYATNANRSHAKLQKILTDFKRKGRAGKYEKSRKMASSIIRKERGSRLEGSFGVEKRMYGLEKIKARTKLTEELMVYFGIHTKNMIEIGNRIYEFLKAPDSPKKAA